MPPKRKRADTAAAPPSVPAPSTSTRGRTRNATKTANATSEVATVNVSNSVTSKSTSDIASGPQTAPPVKKSRATTKAKATKASGSTSKAPVDDGLSRDHDSFPTKVSSKTAPAKTPASLRDSQPINDSSVTDLTKMSSRTQHPPVPKSYERYNAARAVALFQKYADPDDPNVIGPEGFSQLCDEAHIPMDGALPLVLAWQLQAKEMGKFTRDEWISAMSALQISSLPQLTVAVMDLDNLLIKGGQAVKRTSPAPSTVKKRGSSDEPYERSTYWTYVTDRKKAFSKLYAFCFAYAKPPTARNIDMETATAFWSVLLSPQYPIMAEVIEFINEKGTYKGVNKDLWGMMLEFCQTVNPNLEDYEADGAWPTLLDDFVLMKSSKSGNDQTSAMVIE